MENEGMTVKKLIEILKQFPQELIVLTDGFDSGFEHIYDPEEITVVQDPEASEYEGGFQVVSEDIPNSFKAIAILRNLRE